MTTTGKDGGGIAVGERAMIDSTFTLGVGGRVSDVYFWLRALGKEEMGAHLNG